MKIREFFVWIGLSLALVASSCSVLRNRGPEEDPWVIMGVTEEQYEAMKKWKSFQKIYYENIDYDDELEKIIIRSLPLRDLPK